MTLIPTLAAMCDLCTWNGKCPIHYEYDYLSGKCHKQYLRTDFMKTVVEAIFYEDCDEPTEGLILEIKRRSREREKEKLLGMIKKAQAGSKTKLANMLMLELENNMRDADNE